MKTKRSPLLLALAMFAILTVALAPHSLANPYVRVPKAGDQVRFDASHSGERSAWAYADQSALETFLRSSIDAALSGAQSEDQHSAVTHARQRALAVDNGTQGLVGEVRAFHYRNHDDTEVQVLIKQGPLRNHIYWTTAAELTDANGRKYLK
jgi:hypothetical protein